MDMVFTSGRMATDMKVVGPTVSSTEKDQIFLQMVTFTPATTPSANQRAKECINGKMAVSTLVSSKKASSTVMESGASTKTQLNVTNLRAITNSTRRTAKALSHGKVETSILATTSTMSETDTERCTGLMARSIEASGKKAFSMERAS